MKTHKTKRGTNHIYSLRRNRGYLQKHLAALLGHRFTQMVSSYEVGTALPPLETALLLEIALGARLSEIYVDLYQELQMKLLARADHLPHAIRRQILGRLLGKDVHEHSGPGGKVT
jgi:DNA-binding XRE family transcriptional regulator